MPMTKWCASSKGLLTFDQGVFCLGFDVTEEDQTVLFQI